MLLKDVGYLSVFFLLLGGSSGAEEGEETKLEKRDPSLLRIFLLGQNYGRNNIPYRPARRMGSEFLGKRSDVGDDEMNLDKRRMGSEFLGKRGLGSEFLGKRARTFSNWKQGFGADYMGKRVMGSEFLGKRSPTSFDDY